MKGGRDPDNRAPFQWDQSHWNHDLRNDFKKFIQIRRENRVLRTGEYVIVHAEGRHLAFLRHLEDQRMLVVINAGDGNWELNIETGNYIEDGTLLKDLVGGGEAQLVDGHLRNWNLVPWEGAIFKPVVKER
jgi:glycosidase